MPSQEQGLVPEKYIFPPYWNSVVKLGPIYGDKQHVDLRKYISLRDHFEVVGKIADVFYELKVIKSKNSCWILLEHKTSGKIQDAMEQLSNTAKYISQKNHSCDHIIAVIEGRMNKNDSKMYSFRRPLKKDLDKYPSLSPYKENKVLYIQKDRVVTIPNGQGEQLFILNEDFFNKSQVLEK